MHFRPSKRPPGPPPSIAPLVSLVDLAGNNALDNVFESAERQQQELIDDASDQVSNSCFFPAIATEVKLAP